MLMEIEITIRLIRIFFRFRFFISILIHFIWESSFCLSFFVFLRCLVIGKDDESLSMSRRLGEFDILLIFMPMDSHSFVWGAYAVGMSMIECNRLYHTL